MSLQQVDGQSRYDVHISLSELPLFSPEFYICNHVYNLALLLHDADYFHQVKWERQLFKTG